MEKKKKEEKPKMIKHGSYAGRGGGTKEYMKMLEEAAKAPVKIVKPLDIKPEPPEGVIKRVLKKIGRTK